MEAGGRDPRGPDTIDFRMAAGPTPDHDVARDIDALYAAWRDAFRRRDVEAAMRLLAPGYTIWPAGQAPAGADEVRRQLEAAFAIYDIDSTFERVERFHAGPLVIDCGWDIQVVRPRSGGPPQTGRQRVFVIVQRGDDGQWRFSRAMTNRESER